MTTPPDRWAARPVLACGLSLLLLAVAPALVMVTATPARAAPSTPDASAPVYTKFYVVPSGGQPLRLRDLAARFLGDGNRYLEILDLNGGRAQPDGGTLTATGVLHPGWLLVLPWDASGPGVSYGALPSAAPKPAVHTPPPPKRPSKSPPPPHGSKQPPAAGCTSPTSGRPAAAPPTRTATMPWAQLRLAPDNAWTRSRGRGATVAVVDYGVDADVPALAGRVLAGSSTVPGGDGGENDCVEHGTAVAGIIAADRQQGSTFTGMAPDATILPIRVASVPGDDTVRGREIASAIRLAVSGGAQVVAVTASADLSQVDASLAIDAAIAQNVAVVVPAATGTPSPAGRPGLLRVGGAGADGAPAVTYPPGDVDVLAPGVRVTSIGLAGTGTVQRTGADFAAAFVAGLLALMRSAQPDEPAVSVVRAVETSADHGSTASPDPVSGWGFIDPGAALGARPPAGTGDGGGGSGGGTSVAVVLAILLGLGALAAGVYLSTSGSGRHR